MIQFTDEMVQLINNARDDGYPCIIATASNDGTPNAGYIGTVLAVDEASFVYRDRTSRDPLEHIEENPRVVVLYRHSARDVGWKFRCTPTIHRNGPLFDDMMNRLIESGLVQDITTPGAVVMLRVDQVLTLFGDVLQEREPGLRW
ncbi:MAG: pyridoxamine 5'-phosphate oxidase family protein [Candidatus Tectomicrobia bacterium]